MFLYGAVELTVTVGIEEEDLTPVIRKAVITPNYGLDINFNEIDGDNIAGYYIVTGQSAYLAEVDVTVNITTPSSTVTTVGEDITGVTFINRGRPLQIDLNTYGEGSVIEIIATAKYDSTQTASKKQRVELNEDTFTLVDVI